MWLVSKRDRSADSVADQVARQVAEAAALAQIDGQDRLGDPRTNPAVRPLADTLLVDQHRHALKAAHGRVLRRHRIGERSAAHAEAALEAIRQAKEARSPARSVLALHRGRRYWMTASLATSLILSAGAASGVAALAEQMDAPALAGWVAEAGGTVLSTAAISYRAHLASHDDHPTGWHNTVLWALTFIPLASSIAANIAGAGLVGVLCSVGAAAFALLAHVVGEASAQAMLRQAKRVTDEDERALHAAAVGDDLFTVPTGSGHQVDTDEPVDTGRGDHKPVPTPEPTHVATGEHKVSDHTPVPTAVPTSEHSAVATPVTTSRQDVEPTPESVPTGDVPTEVATPEPTAVATDEPTEEPTLAKAPSPAPKTTPQSAAKPKAKRRTRDEIRAALQKALKEHYDNGGGEPQVKPLAEQIGVNRRIVRELLDEMNVRPMIRKAV